MGVSKNSWVQNFVFNFCPENSMGYGLVTGAWQQACFLRFCIARSACICRAGCHSKPCTNAAPVAQIAIILIADC